MHSLGLVKSGPDLPPVVGWLPFQLSHFAQAAQVPFGSAELGCQEGLHQVPGHRWSYGPAAHADDVHMIVLDPLPGGEVVVNQAGANARNLVGADRGTDAAAADGDPPFHLPRNHSLGQWDDEIGIVVTRVQTMSTEIDHLMAGSSKLGHQLFLQTKPAMIGGDSHPLGQAESHQEASLSFR